MSTFKIGFVILHYMNIDVTIECVNSIKQNVGEESYKIIIIDNNSPNKSGESLKKEYRSDKKVDIYLNTINDGFARGNNIGYSMLRKECDYICILNNDVELIQSEFYKSVEAVYQMKKFGIMGPRIKMLDGSICRLMPQLGTYREERKKYIKKELRYIVALLGLNRIREIVVSNKVKLANDNNNIQEECNNIILHGCCLIYSKDYIENNEWAFDPRTDFYGEEALLYLHVMKQKLSTLYSPTLTILHKESVATKTSKSTYKKTIFQLGNTAKSQRILLKELRSNMRGISYEGE